MKPIKLSGAGNTFVLEILGSGDPEPTVKQALKFCDENKVDGYLALIKANTPHAQFKWSFFNNDGSQAEFCGNAARCAQYFLNKQLNVDRADQITKTGTVKTWTENNQHWVQMPDPKIFETQKSLTLGSQNFVGFWCDTGVPHFVVELKGSKLDPALSKNLRFHPDLGPRGANVTWIQSQLDQAPFEVVTYERGVEDFTQACGTGALAAALVAHVRQPSQMDFQVKMPGGLLQLKKDGTHWIMTGPVEEIGLWSGSV